MKFRSEMIMHKLFTTNFERTKDYISNGICHLFDKIILKSVNLSLITPTDGYIGHLCYLAPLPKTPVNTTKKPQKTYKMRSVQS